MALCLLCPALCLPMCPALCLLLSFAIGPCVGLPHSLRLCCILDFFVNLAFGLLGGSGTNFLSFIAQAFILHVLPQALNELGLRARCVEV